jgi:gliding motility-associated-like protein
MNIFTRSILFIIFSLVAYPGFAQPTANFTATPTVGCAPLLVQFTSTSTGNPTSYSWNLGNSTTSSFQNPSTSYTIPGTYTVTLTVTNSAGSNTKTVTNYITVYGPPIVSFTATDTSGCPPFATSFVNSTNLVTPGGGTYSWSFGDGNISTLANPGHTYAAPGYYNVTLVATNSGGCVSSLTKPNYIHVYDNPVGDFTASPTNFCDTPATTAFTTNIAGTGPYTYAWTFGDGGIGSGGNPSHTYSVPGSFTINMVVTDVHGCKDTVTKPNYVSVGTTFPSFTPTPSAGCVNTPMTFNNTSIGANIISWDFGDGGTSNVFSPTHVYTTAGIYNVKLVIQNGICSDSVTIPVTVHPQPDAQFTFTPKPPCPAPITLQYINNSTGATSYQWDFGDGGTSSLANPTHTYLANGGYTMTLIATSAFGCKDTIVATDTVFPLILQAGAVPMQGCVPLSVYFSNQTYTTIPSTGVFYPYGTATWNWDFGDGFTSTQDTVTHTYTSIGTYQVVLNITTVNGCNATDTLFILVGPHPTASFTVSPDTICNREMVTFTNTSVGANAYIWDFGDGGASSATSPVHQYTSSGNWTVTLHAYNNGCEDTFKVDSMILVHPPTSKFSYAYSCDTPLKVKFYDTASIEPTSLIWYFGDGGTSTQSNPVHIYPTLGIYNVTLITFNSIYGCSDTLTKQIELISPVPSFTTPDTAICRWDSIILTPSYTGIATWYRWYVNNAFVDTGYVGQYTFNQRGIYNIKVVITDLHGCFDTATRNNYIHVSKPYAGFKGLPTVGCVPLNVLFTDTSSNIPGAYQVTRAWTYGDGGSGTFTTATTNHTYLTAGFFDVNLIVTDNVGCSDTLLKPAYIEARKPIAAFASPDTTLCIGQAAQFVNSSVGTTLSYSWDFGDGGISFLGNPTHAYNATGLFTVRLIVTDPTGCKDTLTRLNYANVQKPNAAFTMSDTLAICPPLNVLFTNTSTGGVNYAWSFGNSSTSTIQNPSAIYTNPGIYSIRLIVTNSFGCTDTAYGSANVLGYAGGLTYSPLAGCAPLDVSFIATLTNVPVLVWDFSDGSTQPVSGSSTTTHTYLTPGAYVPKLILSDGAGCLNSSQGLDTIKVDGVFAGYTAFPPCINTLMQFQDTSFSFFSPVTSWYWSFDNGLSTSTISNPTNTYSTTGNHPVYLIATNSNGCADTLLSNVTIFDLPIITAGPDTSICVGDAAILNGGGGVSYVWTPAATLSCSNCQSPSASPPGTTNYIVTGTDGNGCQNTDTVAVKIQFITTSAVDNGGDICDDSTFQLLAYGAQTYLWKPAATLNNSAVANPFASPHATTIYTVLAWEGSCPPDSHTVKVTVYPKPTVDAGGDVTIVAGSEVMLNATGTGVDKFLWSPITTLSCEDCSNPTANPMITTLYKVTAVSRYGCKNYDSVTVHVVCDKSQVFIPNTFTPNGDGENDIFFPRGEGIKKIKSLRVYNRWGEIVFEKNNIEINDQVNGWDGTFKGAQLKPDTFVYLVEGVCESDAVLTWKGDINLIR